MFLLTLPKKQYSILASGFLCLTIGSYFYFFHVCDLVCGRKTNRSHLFCCIATTVGCCIAVGLVIRTIWRNLRSTQKPFLECVLSLVGTMPSGFTFYALLKVLVYAETVQVLCHIRELSIIPVTIAGCLKNETIQSSQLIRNSSIFHHEHMNYVNTGIADIVSRFNNVNGTQIQLRNAVEIGYGWLESRGIDCQQILTRPFVMCLNAIKEAKKDCLLKGVETLCDIVDISEEICWKLMALSKGPCQYLSPEKITGLFASLRQRLGSLTSGVIRMRVGILFEIHVTSNVGDQLSKAWTGILESLVNTAELVHVIYNIMINYLLKFVALTALLLWPVSYLCYYVWGPISFDNSYITKAEYLEIQELGDMADEDETELQMVPVWILTLKEIIQILWNLLFSTEQLIIVAILLIDFYSTSWLNDLHLKWLAAFRNLRTAIFERIGQPSQITGIGFIGEMVAQQLEKFQKAIGFDRLVSCVHPAPPITYSRNIFFVAFAQKALYLFVQTNWRCLPSFICARFYRRRHYLRMSYLKAKIMLRPIAQKRRPLSRCYFATYFRRMLSALFRRLRGSVRGSYRIEH